MKRLVSDEYDEGSLVAQVSMEAGFMFFYSMNIYYMVLILSKVFVEVNNYLNRFYV